MNKGKYHCYWGDGTVGFDGKTAIMEEHDIEYFSEDRGYPLQNIEEITELEPGEGADLTMMTQRHFVVCIERPDPYEK